MSLLFAPPGPRHPDAVSRVPAFHLHLTRRSDACIIRIGGELDFANLCDVENAFAAAEASDATWIVLDLATLAFIDSTNLRAFLRASRRAAADGDRLRIAHVRPEVERTFRLAGLEAELPLIPGGPW